MRKLLLLSGLVIALLAACSKNDNTGYDPTPQFRADTAAIRSYINTNNLTATKDTSGIFYNISALGNGVDSVSLGTDTVKVLYTGRLLNGTVFDSSGVNPVKFPIGGTILGFQFAATQIFKGGKIRVYVPSYFGYGNNAMGGLPANSVLIFDVELLDIIKRKTN